ENATDGRLEQAVGTGPIREHLAQCSPNQTSALACDTMTQVARSAMLGPRQRERVRAKVKEVLMEQTKEFALTLDDRPGTLAKVTDAIASAGINIEGYAAVPSGKDGKGVFRVITKDPASTKKALEGAGFKVQEERDVALVEVD